MSSNTRTARSTGTRVTVGSADDLMLDADNGRCKWYTVCDAHGTCIGHTSRRLANYHAPVPEEWCDECAAAVK